MRLFTALAVLALLTPAAQAKTKTWKKIKVENKANSGSFKHASSGYGWRSSGLPKSLKANYETCRKRDQTKGKVGWRIKANGMEGVTWTEVKVRVKFKVGTSMSFKPSGSGATDADWRAMKKERAKHSSVQLKVGSKGHGWLTPEPTSSHPSSREKSRTYTLKGSAIKDFGKNGTTLTLEAKLNSKKKCPEDDGEFKYDVIKRLYKGYATVEVIHAKYEEKKSAKPAPKKEKKKEKASKPESSASNIGGRPEAAVYPRGHSKWNDRAWFFKGPLYRVYKIKEDKPSGQAKAISRWPGMPAGGADAAVYLKSNRCVYFFKGSTYWKYSLDKNKVLNKRRIGKDGWYGLDKAFPGGPDAAVSLDENRIYFFKGNKYVRYNLTKDKVDSAVRTLNKDGWTGVTMRNIDAAIRWSNGNIYFFGGDRYQRFNIKKDKVNSGLGYTSKGWGGL